MTTLPARLKAHLEQAHVSYIRIPHVPARSSQYAASLLHVPGKEVAKTVALHAGKQV
jgi:prolyl-tRNA editing enzyme YbaK/EbsC (Cys-tRNA(Pro) deacylase)